MSEIPSLCECCSDRPGVDRLAGGGEAATICDACFDGLLASFRGVGADGHLMRIGDD